MGPGLVDTPPEKPRPCGCPALEPLTAPAPLEGAGLRLRPLHHWPLGDRSRRVTTDTRGLLSDAARGGQLGRRPAARAPLLVGPHESEGFHSLIGDTNPRYQTQQQTGLWAQRLRHQTLQPRTPRVLLGHGGGRCPRSLGTASGKDQQVLWVRQCGPSLQKLSAATWLKAPR